MHERLGHHHGDDHDELEPWETDESRSRRNSWRGPIASEEEPTADSGETVALPADVFRRLATAAVKQLQQQVALQQLQREVEELRSALGQLTKVVRGSGSLAPLEPAQDALEDAGIRSAVEALKGLLHEIFGEQSSLDVRLNDDPESPEQLVVIEAHYGAPPEMNEEELWQKHREFLSRYLTAVPREIRQRLVLIRTVE